MWDKTSKKIDYLFMTIHIVMAYCDGINTYKYMRCSVNRSVIQLQ